MKKNTPPAVDKLAYEEALSELESVVEALENSQPTLEESLALYERGQALALHCAVLLDQAEQRVRRLSEVEPDLDAAQEDEV
jgi:exodeoxyribonuclease VII small subunit